MLKTQIDGTALAAAALAALFGFTLLTGPFTWIASIGGLVLAIVLFSFDGEVRRSMSESIGFSAVVALCLTLASPLLFRFMALVQGATLTFEGRVASEYLPLTWLGLTLFLCVVDRSRMGGRVPQSLPAGPLVAQAPMSFIPRNAVAAPAPVTSPVPVAMPVAPPPPAPPPPRPEPVPVAAPEAPVRATFTQPSFGATAVPVPEVHTPAAFAPAAPLPAAAPVEFVPSPPAPEPFVPAPAPVSAPAAMAAAPGKEATVYVTLVGEGLNVLRAVRAEHLGRDFYKIVEDMPVGETWQFGPGQVVRAKKRNLSSGKAMVAIEEAPRAS